MLAYNFEILDSLAKIVPLLTHLQKEKLLSFGEGMAFANEERHGSADGAAAGTEADVEAPGR